MSSNKTLLLRGQPDASSSWGQCQSGHAIIVRVKFDITTLPILDLVIYSCGELD
jgi:hypothetical protein